MRVILSPDEARRGSRVSPTTEEQRSQAGKGPQPTGSTSNPIRRSRKFQAEKFRRFFLSEYFNSLLRGKGEGLSGMGSDYSGKRALEILELAKSHFGLEDIELRTMIRGDLRRPAIAVALARQTTLSQTRIAEILNMKNAANVSQQMRRFNSNKTQNRKITQFIRKSEIGT